jgi:putative acetyltransferase
MVIHLVDLARQRGHRRVSLKTGSMAAFEPTRSLHARCGFRVCGPFADDEPSVNSTFMRLDL